MDKFQKEMERKRRERYEWQMVVHAIMIVVILFIILCVNAYGA